MNTLESWRDESVSLPPVVPSLWRPEACELTVQHEGLELEGRRPDLAALDEEIRPWPLINSSGLQAPQQEEMNLTRNPQAGWKLTVRQ